MLYYFIEKARKASKYVLSLFCIFNNTSIKLLNKNTFCEYDYNKIRLFELFINLCKTSSI
ncbi:hypothetical protein FVB9288_01288 [Flavobacterium sp. CECT 9288]|nr:hypothetical protein FVB9288_01288 [Flavobacterium sp. CECT 9288]